MSAKLISLLLAGFGLGALARYLLRGRKSRRKLNENVLAAYVAYIDTGVVSPELLLLGDSAVLEAIERRPPGDEHLTHEVLAAMRESCGSDELQRVEILKIGHEKST